MPFRFSNNFLSKLMCFEKNHVSQSVTDTLRSFILEHGMNTTSYFRPVRIEYFKRVKTQLNGVEMTDEDFEIIFEYLRVNNIPPINDTYRIVRDRYLNGEITKETIEQISNENKSRKTLEKILGCTKTLKREELFK